MHNAAAVLLPGLQPALAIGQRARQRYVVRLAPLHPGHASCQSNKSRTAGWNWRLPKVINVTPQQLRLHRCLEPCVVTQFQPAAKQLARAQHYGYTVLAQHSTQQEEGCTAVITVAVPPRWLIKPRQLHKQMMGCCPGHNLTVSYQLAPPSQHSNSAAHTTRQLNMHTSLFSHKWAWPANPRLT